MKTLLLLLLSSAILPVAAKDDPAHRQALVDQHKAIAAAHQAAAQCLASGKKEDACHEELTKACKGIAIGRLCGMKHKH